MVFTFWKDKVVAFYIFINYIINVKKGNFTGGKMKLEVDIEKGMKENELIFIITPVEQLNQKVALTFEIMLLTLINGGATKFVINLSQIEYIDSTGIGKIINITKILRKRNGEIALVEVPQKIMEVFNLIKLEKFIKIFHSREEGVNYLKLV